MTTGRRRSSQTWIRRRRILCRPPSVSSASLTRRSWRMPTYVGSTWGPLVRTTRGGTSSRSWGKPCPTPPPMQAAVRGSMVEVSTDLPSSVAPLVMRASGKARVVHFRFWIVTGTAAPRVRAVVQAATGALRTLPGGLEDPR